MENFKDRHEIHGLIIGALVGLFTKSPVKGAIVGGSLYLYMSQYGHEMPK